MAALRLFSVVAGRCKLLLCKVCPSTRRQLIPWLTVGALLWGAGDHHHLLQGAPRKPKPWFDAKAAFVFALGEGSLPASRDQLADGLSRGWKAHLRFPEGGDIVHTDGGRFPAIGTLHVRLGGGILNTDDDAKEEPPFKPSGKIESKVAIRDFDLDARPLIMDKARLDVHLSAVDAIFDVERDQHGRPMVMMSDAKNASLQFGASNEDLQRIIIMDLNDAAEKFHVTFKNAKLKIEAQNNRSIDLDLHLSTRVAFVPAGMRFQAHIDIDDDMFARLSRLRCEGDEALGPLIVGLIRPGLKKYEGKSRLIFSFPTGQLKLRDVKIQGGDDVRIGATFSR